MILSNTVSVGGDKNNQDVKFYLIYENSNLLLVSILYIIKFRID